MKDFGTVRPGSTLYIEFDSFGANGESLTLTGLAVTDIEVYKDGSTTQRASDNGYTLLDTDGIDFDSLTGIHGFSINLADNTTSGFWAAGSHYRVVVSAVTINSQTVSFTAATFRIGYEAAVLNTTIATLASQTSFTLTSGPAEDDALNGMWAIIHDAASAVQFSWVPIKDYTGSTKTVTLETGVTATFTAAAGDNFSVIGPMPLQVTTLGRKFDCQADGRAPADIQAWAGETVPSLVGGPGGNVPADVNTISGSSTAADNAEIVFDTDFAANYNTTLDAWNVNTTHAAGTAWASGAITASVLAADCITAAKLAADVTTELQSGLATASALGTVDTVVDSILAAIGTPSDLGGGATLAANADDIYNYQVAVAGGLSLTDLATASDLTSLIATVGVAGAGLTGTRDLVVAIFTDDVGTAQAGASGTITLQSGASSTNDYYNNAVVVITGGTGAGQSRQITDYVGSTRVASVDTNWVTNPDNTSTYIVLGRIV